MRILVASGVNLDLLGRREPGIYGTETLDSIHRWVRERAPALALAFGVGKLELKFFQSNAEAEFLEEISKDWHGAVINPGAWTHTSLALADRLAGLRLKFVEVHLSNISAREEIRQKSLSARHAVGVVYGFGAGSYLTGLCGLLDHLVRQQASHSKI